MKQILNHADYRRRGIRRHIAGAIMGIVVGCGVGHAAYADSFSNTLNEACGSNTSRTVHPWPSSRHLTASCYDSVSHDWRIARVLQLSSTTAQNRMSRNAWGCEYELRQDERRLVTASVTPRSSCMGYARDLEADYMTLEEARADDRRRAQQ